MGSEQRSTILEKLKTAASATQGDAVNSSSHQKDNESQRRLEMINRMKGVTNNFESEVNSWELSRKLQEARGSNESYLRVLATDPNPLVRAFVARNPATPTDILEKIYQNLNNPS